MSEHTSGDQEVLRLDGLCKRYNAGQPTETQVLHGLSLRLQRSDFTALTGSSGSGKSTLLNLIGLLDTPTAGELHLLGQPTSGMDEAQRTALRGQHIGFVFQFHHLITAFTALENVLMPLALAHGKPTREHTEFAQHLLAQVGLEKLAHQRPLAAGITTPAQPGGPAGGASGCRLYPGAVAAARVAGVAAWPCDRSLGADGATACQWPATAPNAPRGGAARAVRGRWLPIPGPGGVRPAVLCPDELPVVGGAGAKPGLACLAGWPRFRGGDDRWQCAHRPGGRCGRIARTGADRA